MAASFFPFSLITLRDLNGALVNGSIEFFNAGLYTHKTVWLDRDKTTPADNPISLDSNCAALVYGDGLYRVIIKDSAGTVVYDYDNINVSEVSADSILASITVPVSADVAPTSPYAYMVWIDTSSEPAIEKIRNGANDGWIASRVIDNNAGSVKSYDSQKFNNQLPAYYLNASNISAGTLSLDRIPTALTGKDADTLDGKHGTFYTPTGMVATFAMSTAPEGWLECNGAVVSRTTYATLFAAIGTTYGSGDGSTTFAIPDLRGEFVRGWDHGKGTDTGRAIGTAQADSLKAHVHTVPYGAAAGNGLASGNGLGVTDTSSTGGTETRPRNIALMYCIKD